MKSALIASATGAFLLLLSTAAYADPPPGVGAAIVASGFECTIPVPVRPGEAFPILPGGYGIVLAPILDNNRSIFTNSANGNINLSCHGRIEYGSEVTAIDWATGFPVTATITEFDEGCEVIAPVLPDVCIGNGVAIQNAESVYHPILFPDGGSCEIYPGLFTSDFRSLLTRSGRVAINCQYVEE